MHLTQFLCLTLIIYVKVDFSSAVKCQHYNETWGPEESFTSEVDCGSDNNCYVLWRNSTNDTRSYIHTKLKGCFRLNGDCSDQKACVASSKSKNDLFFCCCEGDLCNEKYSWAPNPTRLPNPPIVEEDLSQETDTISTVAMYVVLPLSVLVSFCIYVLLKKQKIAYIKKRFKLVPLMDPHRSSSSALAPTKLRRIELLEVIAARKIGSVKKAIDLDTMQKVAVKIMFSQEEASWQTEQEIYQLPLMGGHENILQFVAAEKRNIGPQTEYWLITTYHEKGSLQDFLKTNTVTWDQLCKIAYSMANGLAHMHEEIPSDRPNLWKPSIAHRDFKSSNVLLKNDSTACIADFGLALIFRPAVSCGDTHGQVGTRRYMAPEVLEGAINFSRDAFLRIDMYAFGLVLWELASRCSSVPDPVSDFKLPFEVEVGVHPTIESMQDVVVNKKLRPVIKDSWKNTPGFQLLCDTIEECWDHDAEARLSASCVVERIIKAQQIWRMT